MWGNGKENRNDHAWELPTIGGAQYRTYIKIVILIMDIRRNPNRWEALNSPDSLII